MMFSGTAVAVNVERLHYCCTIDCTRGPGTSFLLVAALFCHFLCSRKRMYQYNAQDVVSS